MFDSVSQRMSYIKKQQCIENINLYLKLALKDNTFVLIKYSKHGLQVWAISIVCLSYIGINNIHHKRQLSFQRR